MNKKTRRAGRGWHNESRRHALASKGVKTRNKTDLQVIPNFQARGQRKKQKEITEPGREFLKQSSQKEFVEEVVQFIVDMRDDTQNSVFTRINQELKKQDLPGVEVNDILDLRADFKGGVIFGDRPSDIKSELVEEINNKLEEVK